MDLSEDTINRLSIGLIDKFEYSPEEALEKLSTFSITLTAGEALRDSLPLQAAFITAVNSGTRAFLGGVYINMPSNVKCLLPWNREATLNDIAISLGAKIDEEAPKAFTLMFGRRANIDEGSIEIVANSWQGGVLVNGEEFTGPQTGSLPLGGIYAAGLGIGIAFLKISKLHPQAADKSVGLSLWRPDLDWLSNDASGPEHCNLPNKAWVLGLGHLGQAYLWALGLLPFSNPKDVNLFLQDFDRIVKANVSAGLLCSVENVGKYKSRVCSDWLESRGFRTTLIERKYDITIRREQEEPSLALCGFDNAKSRTILLKSGFDLIIESALGNDMLSFDNIILHTFPNAVFDPEKIWNESKESKINSHVLEVLAKGEKKICGILEETIAGKAVSASFVGACAGALVIAEAVRAVNLGSRYDKIVTQLRFADETRAFSQSNSYSTVLVRNGYQKASCPI